MGTPRDCQIADREVYSGSACSAEHYMMWGKAMLFGDGEMSARILARAMLR